jgi:hypothetical protein
MPLGVCFHLSIRIPSRKVLDLLVLAVLVSLICTNIRHTPPYTTIHHHTHSTIHHHTPPYTTIHTPPYTTKHCRRTAAAAAAATAAAAAATFEKGGTNRSCCWMVMEDRFGTDDLPIECWGMKQSQTRKYRDAVCKALGLDFKPIAAEGNCFFESVCAATVCLPPDDGRIVDPKELRARSVSWLRECRDGKHEDLGVECQKFMMEELKHPILFKAGTERPAPVDLEQYLVSSAEDGVWVEGKTPYTTIHRHTPPFTAIHHCNPPYTTIHHHSPPYTTIHRHTQPYTTIHHHTPPFTAIHRHTPPYTTIHHHTPPCTTMHHHTPPYTAIPQSARAVCV